MVPDPVSTTAGVSAGFPVRTGTRRLTAPQAWPAAVATAGAKGLESSMQVTGTRQREAWQRAEFPPVEKVTGGVWSVPVPIIDNPLRYVLSYLIEHDAGFVMIDPGWNHPDSWQALTSGLG